VLTGDQQITDAAWAATDELALEPYAGQTIRVLAREQGVTDPRDYFDATYTVRDTYPPAWDLGTEANPTGAIKRTTTDQFRGWATGWENLRRGPNVSGNWLERPVGDFLGEVAASNDNVNGATTHLVVLGDGGEITATFGSPIVDGTGADFAVFENGFRILGGTLEFAELAYVEVSSDGEHFVQFDSATLNNNPVGAFAGLKASDHGGVAGQYWTGYGTGFDLATLKNKPAVRSGQVDLDAITHVKIKDIAGCGEDRDSFGRVIYDPCGTVQSGGFDLTGIGVINQADEIAWIDIPQLGSIGPKSATVTSKVTANGHAQNVWAELSALADHSDALATAPFQVRATQRSRPVSFTFADLKRGSTYYYRVVSEGANGGTTRSSWQSFVAPDVLIEQVYAETGKQVIEGDVVHVPLLFTVNPSGGNDFTVQVEYSSNSDRSGGLLTAPKSLSGKFTWPIQISEFLMDLHPDWDYSARVVATGSDGTVTTSPWVDFRPNPVNSYRLEPTLGSTVEVAYSGGVLTACTYVSADPAAVGLSLALYGYDYGTSAEVTGERVPVELVHAGAYACATATGVDPANSYLRLDLYDATGSVTTAMGVTPPSGAPTAQPTDPSVDGITAVGATFTGGLELGQTGSQRVFFEYAPATTQDGAGRTPEIWAIGTWSDSTSVTGLAPATDYLVRTVAAQRHGDGVVTSEWVPFTTAALPAALATVSVSGVERTSALVEVQVAPAGYARALTAEVVPASGGDTVSFEPIAIAADAADGVVSLPVTGLLANTAYRARVVSTAVGVEETTEWVEFATTAAPAELGGSSVSAISSRAATVDVAITPGDLDQQIRVELASGDRADASTTKSVAVPASLAPLAIPVMLNGLAANTTFSYRVVSAAPDGTEVVSEWSTFTTARVSDPTVEVAVSPAAARVGDTVTITWTTTHAAGVNATGAWSGSKALSGSEKVRITDPGSWIFGVTATGEAGNTTSVAAVVPATLPAKQLTVTSQKAVTAAGRKLTVKATGLAAGESYTIAVSGIQAATGRATTAGGVSTSITAPRALGAGNHTVTVTGSTADRTGQAMARLVQSSKKLTMKASSEVRRGKKVTVKVSGLGAYEPVTITVGKTRTTRTATAEGALNVKIAVPKKTKPGKTKISVTGITPGRTGTKTIKIVK
ncbi:MAG: hypothetical protein KIT69_10590, partial [Propionibacteriaceae bacterium]|nr:hypothetical protein [Propionibacteriaceae bacterium]